MQCRWNRSFRSNRTRPAIWMYGSESRVQRKASRFAAQSKAAPLRRLAPARLGRPSRARCVATPPTEKHPARCLRHSRLKEGSLRGSACGGSGLRPSSRLRPAPLRPPFPPPPLWPLRASRPSTLRAGSVPIAGPAVRGARMLLSGMLAQVPVGTRVKRHAPLRRSGGARQRASSRPRSVAAPVSRFAAHAHLTNQSVWGSAPVPAP